MLKLVQFNLRSNDQLFFFRKNLYVFFLVIWLLVGSCGGKSKSFYVGQIDVHIDIEDMGDNRHRVYIYRYAETRNSNYIDLTYHMCEIPSITLYFPNDNKKKIFIIDNRSDIQGFKSVNFEIDLLRMPFVRNGELMTDDLWNEFQRYNRLNDSISHISSVTVQLDAYLQGLTVWDENDSLYRVGYAR